MMRGACQEVQKQWVEIHYEKFYLLSSENHEKKFILQQYENLLKYILKVKKKQDNNQEKNISHFCEVVV